ncbi:neo-calmodulin-like [Lineus longissimus]|uniref:neo-calmodulin-like n=1 Tax=Lineus longissimus TaxID=88925 RepID=UPI002B4C4B7B
MDKTTGKLTEKDIQELKTAFRLMDDNHDGYISASELKEMMFKLGLNITEDEVDRFIQQADLSGTGLGVSETDFLEWMASRCSDEHTALRDVFIIFDKNGDGLISKEELKNGLEAIGENLSESLLDDLFRMADLNKDGFVNFEEFVIIMSEERGTPMCM